MINNNNTLISLLPIYPAPETLFYASKSLVQDKGINSIQTTDLLKKIKRQLWQEGLYILPKDLNKFIRYKNPDGSFKQDFTDSDFYHWIKLIENNTALCELENESIGYGIFVPPGKILPRGTFIPSAGIINLQPTVVELETKVHCSAIQDLNSPAKQIMGFIDPEHIGGILNFINHAPDPDELANFVFNPPLIKNNVATANLRSTIKFYKGYAIMGLYVFEEIVGEKNGTQLLWSYAQSCEYIDDDHNEHNKPFFLFDKRSHCRGRTIDIEHYAYQVVDIYVDAGELILQKVASLTRWELMQKSPTANLVITSEDPYSPFKAKPIQSMITHKPLQDHLRRNPHATRIIIQAAFLKKLVSKVS